MATSLSTAGLSCKTWFLRSTRAHNPNGISVGSAVFVQRTAECPYTLPWDAPFPHQNCPFSWGTWTLSNTWFRGPTRVHNPNGISIDAAVLAWLISVTDRQTDTLIAILCTPPGGKVTRQSVTADFAPLRNSAAPPGESQWLIRYVADSKPVYVFGPLYVNI